jgi:hypothetical protein
MLLDIAEGVRAAASTLHLEQCQLCRTRVEQLRRTLDTVAAVDVPEPSPLFWDHLSARVRDAVAVEPPVPAGWWPTWSWPMTVAMSAAVVLLAVGLAVRGGSAGPGTPSVSAPPLAELETAADVAEPLPDDASLQLLADLASGMDWDDAAGAVMVVRKGSSDLALTGLSATERAELQRILTEELAGQTL